MLPDVGLSRRLMQRISVDFPAPENPMIPKISPSRIYKDTSCTAWTFPEAVSNVLLMCSSFIMFWLLSILVPIVCAFGAVFSGNKKLPSQSMIRTRVKLTWYHLTSSGTQMPDLIEYGCFSQNILYRCNGRSRHSLKDSTMRLRDHLRKLLFIPSQHPGTLCERNHLVLFSSVSL